MKIIDAHVHAREAHTPEFRETVPIYSASSAAVYMMNFPQPLDLGRPAKTAQFMQDYHAAIMDVAAKSGNPKHRALLMPVLSENMEPAQLRCFINIMNNTGGAPLAGFKLFPKGQSTNTGYAPSTEMAQMQIDVLEDMGVPLALHMEDPDEPDVSKKEHSAMDKILPQLVERNGKPRDMKISVEHISTAYGLITALNRGLWCTITPHHLGLCQEDFDIDEPREAEEILRAQYPYFYCKPILQTRENKDYLREFWVFGEYDKLMLGTDAAPHLIEKKQSNSPPAGIFMGDTVRAYRQIGFNNEITQPLLQNYSRNAARFYGLNMADLSKAKEPGDHHLQQVMNVRAMVGERIIKGRDF